MKKLKNTTGSDLTVMGQVIAAGTYYTLSQFEENAWRDDPSIEALIDSGDLVYNNGTDITDKPRAKDLLNAADATQLRDILIETTAPNNGKVLIYNSTDDELQWGDSLSGIGTVLEFHFSAGTNNTNNAWLTHHDPSAPSNNVPAITPQQVEVKGVTFSNLNDDSSTDIQLFKNSVLVATVEVRNKRYYWKVGATLATFSQADRMSVYLKKYGLVQDAPSKPQISVYCKIISEGALTGGEQYGD